MDVKEHQFRCLVRQVIAWRRQDRGMAVQWLNDYERKNGPELGRAVLEQWQKGNRGKWGDWRE